jgi:hypothetical protein
MAYSRVKCTFTFTYNIFSIIAIHISRSIFYLNIQFVLLRLCIDDVFQACHLVSKTKLLTNPHPVVAKCNNDQSYWQYCPNVSVFIKIIKNIFKSHQTTFITVLQHQYFLKSQLYCRLVTRISCVNTISCLCHGTTLAIRGCRQLQEQ